MPLGSVALKGMSIANHAWTWYGWVSLGRFEACLTYINFWVAKILCNSTVQVNNKSSPFIVSSYDYEDGLKIDKKLFDENFARLSKVFTEPAVS